MRAADGRDPASRRLSAGESRRGLPLAVHDPPYLLRRLFVALSNVVLESADLMFVAERWRERLEALELVVADL